MNTTAAETVPADDDRAPSVAFGGPPAPPPATGDTVLEWFTDWVARQPTAAAIVTATETWTYRDLDLAADRLASVLSDGVERGELVGVCLERSPALVAAAVALARAGAVYLPLGVSPTPTRLRELTDDTGIHCLVTDEDTALPAGWRMWNRAQLAHDGRPGLGVTYREPVPGEPTGTKTTGLRAFSAVTTSGTTGSSKVVLFAESGLANVVRWYCRMSELGPGARGSLLIAPTFDPHQKEMWAALCSGSTLCVAPEEARSSAGELVEWWRQAGITSCILPTPLAELVFARTWPADLALRHLTVGGDRMRTRPPDEVTAAVHNVYGPAEATGSTTVHHLRPGVPDSVPVPIGTPINGVSVAIADSDGNVVPRGQAGELLIGGASLALGYLNPQRTAEHFITGCPDQPAGGLPMERAYRTGDKARLCDDGEFEFLGRIDEQVKISGVRVEPAEVEAALENHAGVRNAVVVPVSGADAADGGDGGAVLAAFLRLVDQPVDEAPRDQDAILGVARERLVEQAVPTIIRYVTEFPLDANGKLDRAALAERVRPSSEGADTHESTASDTAAFLLSTCQKLLRSDDISLSDHFLEAGGSSLAAAQLLARIESTYRIRLSAAEVLRQPDLKQLADLIELRHQSTPAPH